MVTRGAGLRVDLGPPDSGPFPPMERTGPDGRKVIAYKGIVGREGR